MHATEYPSSKAMLYSLGLECKRTPDVAFEGFFQMPVDPERKPRDIVHALNADIHAVMGFRFT
jgi:hypothetical protein